MNNQEARRLLRTNYEVSLDDPQEVLKKATESMAGIAKEFQKIFEDWKFDPEKVQNFFNIYAYKHAFYDVHYKVEKQTNGDLDVIVEIHQP